MTSIPLPSNVFAQVMIQRSLEGEPRPVLVAEEPSMIVHVASTAHESPKAEPFPSANSDALHTLPPTLVDTRPVASRAMHDTVPARQETLTTL